MKILTHVFTVLIAVSHSKDYLRKIISRAGEWLPRSIPSGLRGRRAMHRALYSGALKATLLRKEQMAK